MSGPGRYVSVRTSNRSWSNAAQKFTYKTFLQSPEWQETRRRVLHRDDYCCVSCGVRATEVHHVSYERLTDPELCISVCRPCHEDCEEIRADDWIAHLVMAPRVARFVDRRLGQGWIDRYSDREAGEVWLRHRKEQKQEAAFYDTLEEMEDWE